MTAEPGPLAAVDVAHEARVRRWTIDRDGDRRALVSSTLLGPLDARDPSGGPFVGRGAQLGVALLSGPEPQLVRAARRALLAAGAEVIATLSTDDGRSFGERATVLREARPELVIVLGGDGRHADPLVELCEAVRFGTADLRPQPRAIVSGDAKTALRLHRVLADLPVEIVSDPRREGGLPALVGRARELRRGSHDGLVLRDEALEALAQALADAARSPAAVVDVTGSSTSIVRADPDAGTLAAHVVPLGTGRGADRVVARAGLDRVRRWIPWAVDAPTLLERVFNRARWPDAVPAELVALALEIALAHEAIAHALADAAEAGIAVDRLRGAPLVALTGALAELPRGAQSLLIAANALRPLAVASVVRDEADALVALGALAARARRDGEDPLAATTDEIARRQRALGVIVPVAPSRRATLRVSGALSHEAPVRSGAFFRIAARGPVDLALPGGASAHAIAGPEGIVVDARDHPLALPPRDAERVPAVAGWFAALEALPSR